MRLLFKHTRRSIFKNKESIIILLTVILSAVMFSLIAETVYSLKEEMKVDNKLDVGNSDIIISADINSESRYITENEIEAIVAGSADAGGYFILPAMYGENIVSAASADLESISDFLPFSLMDKVEVNSNDLSSSIIITERFSKKHNLSVGSKLTLSLLGKNVEYTVIGINKYEIFGEFDIVTDSEGALGVLSSASFVFALFDSDNMPYSKIFLKCNECVNKAELEAKLNDSLVDIGYITRQTAEISNSYTEFLLDVVLLALTVLSVVIAAVLVSISLKIIIEKRAKETENFILAGTPKRMLFLALCAETFVYVALGTAFGLLASLYIIPEVLGDMLPHVTVSLTNRAVAVTVISGLLIWILSLAVYLINSRSDKKEGEKGAKYFVFISLAVIAVTALAIIFIPAKTKYIISIFALASLVILLLAIPAPLLKLVSRLTVPRFKARVGKEKSFLAVKNGEKIKEIQNIYRLLTISITFVLTIFLWLRFTNEQVFLIENLFNGDYIVAGVDDSANEDISSVQGSENVCGGFFATGYLADDRMLQIISLDNSAFSDYYPDEQIGKGEIVMSRETAALYGADIGDSIEISLFQKIYSFKIIGYSDQSAVLGFVNHDANGFKENIFVVEGGGEGYLKRLESALSIRGALVKTPKEATSSLIGFLEVFASVIKNYVLIITIMTTVGCVNLIFVCHSRRKKSFEDLRLLGMSKKDIRVMLLHEAKNFSFIILLICGIASLICAYFLNCAMTSFGHRLI